MTGQAINRDTGGRRNEMSRGFKRVFGRMSGVAVAVVMSALVCGPVMAVDELDIHGIKYPATSGTYTSTWYDTMDPVLKGFANEKTPWVGPLNLDCGIQLQTRIAVSYGKVTASSIFIKSVTVKYYAYHLTRTYPDVAYIELGGYNLKITDGRTHMPDLYQWSGTGSTRTLYQNNTATLVYPVNKTYYLGPNDPSNYWNYLQLRVDFSAPAYSVEIPWTFGAVTCKDADLLNLYGYYSKPAV
jgi:hypothetical protein